MIRTFKRAESVHENPAFCGQRRKKCTSVYEMVRFCGRDAVPIIICYRNSVEVVSLRVWNICPAGSFTHECFQHIPAVGKNVFRRDACNAMCVSPCRIADEPMMLILYMPPDTDQRMRSLRDLPDITVPAVAVSFPAPPLKLRPAFFSP